VLLEKFKPIAIQERWLWVGTDFTETLSVSEANLAIRIITDLSVVTSSLTLEVGTSTGPGFSSQTTPILQPMNYPYLMKMFEDTPGLVTDKLKAVLEHVWQVLRQTDRRGIIFAYDEAQNLSDNAVKDQYPLSVLLDVFQSIQRKGVPFMLALVGLPTLFPKLVETRTYAERMFRVLSLAQLSKAEREEAIVRPTKVKGCPVTFDAASVELISDASGGYPYFIQFICKEIFDVWAQNINGGSTPAPVPMEEIVRKLDTDFFAGRWSRATDRQRELLYVVAHLESADGEFTVQEIADGSSKHLEKSFSNSHVSQMLQTLINAGLIYKNRHGKYSFAVPLMAAFILRQRDSLAAAA
jgi:hypothetical protein